MPALDRDNHRVGVVNSIWLILSKMIQEIVQNKSNIHFRASHKLVVKSRFLLECLYNSSSYIDLTHINTNAKHIK